MKRRSFLSISACGALTGMAGTMAPIEAAARIARGSDHPLWHLWQAWKDEHLDFTGRVIDGPQQRASHSEGQGYGMLLAAEFGDRDAFQRMSAWTDANLAIRRDNLLAWRWLPDVPERVPDLNNASDGDLFHAWALLRASEVFGQSRWRTRALDVTADLIRLCVASRPDRPGTPILLPAEAGFIKQGGIIFNPSYVMPRALRALADASGNALLAQLAQSGLDLMAEIAAPGLIPDWLELTPAGPRPAEGFSPFAGYEAIRIPLFLIWSGEAGHRATLNAATAMSRAPAGTAAVILHPTSGEIIEYSRDAGYRAIAALAQCSAFDETGSAMPPFSRNQPYYPATLHLFALLAQIEMSPKCRPI